MRVQTLYEKLLFTTVRIEVETPSGIGSGTAFLLDVPAGEGFQRVFLVTNKHVVRDATIGRFFFTLSDGQMPRLGKRLDITMNDFGQFWHGHPSDDVDIAVLPLSSAFEQLAVAGRSVFYRSISRKDIPNEEAIQSLDAIENVIFIGYPNGIYDAHNLMPVVRKGITASHPQIDYEGRPIFLIDGSVFPGSSGSPVFIAGTEVSSRDGRVIVSNRFHLLGVISSVAIRETQGKIDFISIPTTQMPIFRMEQLLNLGVVFKAATILETITDFHIKNNTPMEEC